MENENCKGKDKENMYIYSLMSDEGGWLRCQSISIDDNIYVHIFLHWYNTSSLPMSYDSSRYLVVGKYIS